MPREIVALLPRRYTLHWKLMIDQLFIVRLEVVHGIKITIDRKIGNLVLGLWWSPARPAGGGRTPDPPRMVLRGGRAYRPRPREHDNDFDSTIDRAWI